MATQPFDPHDLYTLSPCLLIVCMVFIGARLPLRTNQRHLAMRIVSISWCLTTPSRRRSTPRGIPMNPQRFSKPSFGHKCCSSSERSRPRWPSRLLSKQRRRCLRKRPQEDQSLRACRKLPSSSQALALQWAQEPVRLIIYGCHPSRVLFTAAVGGPSDQRCQPGANPCTGKSTTT